jgi:transcription initiation factor TFIIIB Brf1 subunit/transcription initiation factor TFIIB
VWVGVSGSGGRRSSCIHPGKDVERLCRRPHDLTDAVGCGGRQFPRGRRGPKQSQPYRAHASGASLLSAAFRRLYREALRGYERKLAKGGELKRVKECAGLPQRVAEETEAFVRRFFEVVAGFPPEVVAVAVLWTAAKATGAPRPLEDFLRCSRAEERRVRKAAWRLKEEMRLGMRLSVENYVKTLAARVNLPAPVVKSAVEILERNRRVLFGKNPWVSAAALWLASFKRFGLLKALAEAAGTTPASVRNAANRLRV